MTCTRQWGRWGVAWLALFLFPFRASSQSADPPLPSVEPNDNRSPAGQLRDGVLNLHLELLQARWYPEKDGDVHQDVYAFAEEGRAPQSSGPLIRVPQGTQIHATLRNTLPIAANVFGLHRHPGDPNDALPLAPGETRDVQFLAGEPGTYLYWAGTSGKPIAQRELAETLLSGAFVVDGAGAKPDDRIFVITIWSKGLPGSPGSVELPSINGKSWPYTEHLQYKEGETIHWRVLNPTASDHAMHLHGFYFDVEGDGDGERYEPFPQDLQVRGSRGTSIPATSSTSIGLPTAPGTGSFIATWSRTCRDKIRPTATRPTP